MKKVLITGANSYIGISFENYLLEKCPNDYEIETLDMTNPNWREFDFRGYDSIFHVAGIAHSDNGKISQEKEDLYYAVNTDLAIGVAKKAKEARVKQFIFMSSIIVYGDSAPIGKTKMITRETPVSPKNCYGDSKVQAEKGILELEDNGFKIVILRPPMIYGKGCKGNYPLLSKIAQKLSFFPYIKNERSMLYIENLCELIRLIIINEDRGIYYPQNKEYSNTSELVKLIALKHQKKLYLIPFCEWVLRVGIGNIPIIKKGFGNLSYDMQMSQYKEIYQLYSLERSIELTEL